jgi:hypothetical protein
VKRIVATTKAGTRVDPAPPVTYASPWLLGVLVIAVGWLTHRTWGTRLPAAAAATPAMLAGTAVLSGLAWAYSRARDRLLRWHTTVVTAFAGLSVMITTIVGLSPGWLSIEAFMAVLIALSWNIRRLDVVRGEGGDEHRKDFAEILGLPGARFGRAKVDGPRAEIEVRAANGQSYKDVQKAADQIAALGHLPPGGARIIPNPDDSSRATLVMVTQDVLRHRIPWTGPSRPGGSITEPLRVGMYEDGRPEEFWLPGNWTPDRGKGIAHRNAAHLLIMGMTGAGKTIWALVTAVEILTRRHVVLFWVDVVKGMQSARPIADAVDWLVTDRATAKALLAGLRRVVVHRAEWLGARGAKEWWPGCGIPYLVVWIEEAPAVVAESDVITELSEQLRSVGVSLVLSMQRASGDRLPTSTRSNLGAAACFGTNQRTGGANDAGFALSDETIEAGAHPEIWGADKPGYHYLEAPGVPWERWPVTARGYDADDDQLAHAVAEWAHVRDRLDDGTARALGDAYANRKRPAERPATEEPMDAPDDDYPIPPQPEPELAATVNPREPIPPWDADDVPLGHDDGRPPLSRDDKERIFEEILLGFAERQQDEVRMAELVEAWSARTGQPSSKGRPFLHEMLGRRIDQGQVERLEDGRGVYRLQLLVSPNGHRA